jgi:hypothetical protein
MLSTWRVKFAVHRACTRVYWTRRAYHHLKALVEDVGGEVAVRLAVFGFLLRALLCLDVLMPETSSLEFGLGNLQLGLHLLDFERLVGGVDFVPDERGHMRGARRHRETRIRTRAIGHAMRGAVRFVIIGWDDPAGSAKGAASIWGGRTLSRVAALCLALLCTNVGTIFSAAETGWTFVWRGQL